MKQSAILFLLSFILVTLSCGDEGQSPSSTPVETDLISTTNNPSSATDSLQGTRCHSGVPIPAKGIRIDPATVARPRVVRAGPPVVIPKPGKRFPVEIQKIIQVPDTLKVTTPGQRGVPGAVVTEVKGSIVQARHSPPVTALPMSTNINARVDMSYLTQANGLNNKDVYNIFQDRDGNIWLLTLGGGLNRYDGSTFLYLTKEEGLINNSVRTMLQDRFGDFWIGTERGMCRYNGSSFVHYHREQGFPADVVEAIIEDSKGNLWFGTDAGAFRYDGRQFFQYTTAQGLSDNQVMALREDRRGNIWIGTYNGGVDKFDGQRFTRYSVDEGLSYNRVFVIREDSKGNLWFGTRLGVSKFDGRQFTQFKTAKQFIYGEFNRVRGIVEDLNGNIWFAADGEGISKLEGQVITQYTTEEGLPSDQRINNLMMDRDGKLWVPTFEHGATRIAESVINWDIRDDNAKRNKWLNSISNDQNGNLWFATFGDGALRFDGTSFFQYSVEQGVSNPRVYNVIQDRNGVYWMATWEGGICSFDGINFTHYFSDQGLSDNYVYRILEDSKGRFWITTQHGGVNLFDGISFTHFTIENGLLDNDIPSIMEDSKGNIWLGTLSHGATRYDGKNFTHFTTKEGLKGRRIDHIHEDAHGNIWFGSMEDGISIYNDGKFTTIDKNNGLSSNIVSSLVEDGSGRMWVGTEQGLDILIPDSLNPANLDFGILNFSSADGFRLTGNGPGLYDADDNRLWYDYMPLDLGKFKLSYTAPEIRLSHLELKQVFVDYKRIEDSSYANTLPFGKALTGAFDSVPPYSNYPINLRLPYTLNHLTFHFSALDWSIPRGVKYQYKLEGLEETWSVVSKDGFADYRNLGHGNYTFTVRAAGFTNTWSEPLRYRFTIRPPWWHTWWAYTIFGLLFIGLLLSVRRFEIRRLMYRSEALRLKELVSLKSRLYANITHEFRTPLTVIMGMMDTITGHEQARKLVLRNSRQLLQLVNQMLDLSKLESGSMQLQNRQNDIIRYLNYLTESFYSIARERGIRLSFSTAEVELVMDFDEEKLQHIVYNLLSNALKFTPSNSGGNVELLAQKIEQAGKNWLQIEVRDTGIGISEQNLPHIFDRFYQTDPETSGHTRGSEGTGIGLTLTKEFVELMGGNIAARSAPGKGSTFTILLPVKNEAPLDETETVEITAAEQYTPELAAPAESTNLAAARMTKHLTGEKPFLLIVEDNKDVVTYIRTLLEKDYQIETAPNGKAGLEMALELVPDIIISDVMMPEMDGYELTQTLKTDERSSHIPIILLTAKAEEQDKITGLRHGADAYLVKPFNKAELLVRLEKLTELRRRLQQRYAGLDVAKAATEPASPEDAFLQRLIQLVEAHLDDPEFSAAQLYTAAHISQPQLYRKLMALTGKSPALFIRTVRLRKAADMLGNTDLNISEIAWATGFNDPSYFSRVFHEEFGKTPGEWRG